MLSGCLSDCLSFEAMACLSWLTFGRCACVLHSRIQIQYGGGLQASIGSLKSWGMDPGLEFKVAMEEAERLRAALVYGDADQDHTIKRISKAITVQVRLDQLVLCKDELCLHECQSTKSAAPAAP